MRPLTTILLALTLALGASPALAEHHGHHEGDGGGGGGGHGGHHGEADDDDDDGEGGAPVAVTRTPEQTAFREKTLAREHDLVKELAHRHGRRIAMEDREKIGMHWRHVMRLLRIRELAQDDKDTATVTKVDELIDRADKRFKTQMEKDAG